jgi:hypothetical protein
VNENLNIFAFYGVLLNNHRNSRCYLLRKEKPSRECFIYAYNKEVFMKNTLLTLSAILLFCFISGCGEIKDATDIVFDITENHVFTVQGNSATFSYNVNLEDNDDYNKYKGKIRSIKIDYIRYSITSNTGGGGTGDFYVGNYGSAFSAATKVAQTISFAAGETRGETEVEWLDKAFLENLLGNGKFSVWAVGSGSDVDIILPIVIKIRVTVNPFE